jgi:hypothetical protein
MDLYWAADSIPEMFKNLKKQAVYNQENNTLFIA